MFHEKIRLAGELAPPLDMKAGKRLILVAAAAKTETLNRPDDLELSLDNSPSPSSVTLYTPTPPAGP